MDGITGRSQLSDNLIAKFKRDRPLTVSEQEQCDRELAEIMANFRDFWKRTGVINNAMPRGIRGPSIREVRVPPTILDRIVPLDD